MGITAFLGDEAIARGTREEVTRAVPERDQAAALAFDEETGRLVDLDWRGVGEAAPRGRGRPKLGVTAREVTLLPRHWEWLAAQSGGASAAIRRLVEEAGKAPPSPEARRDAAYRFMSHMCGDRPGYEEALRALYRGEAERLEALIAAWPNDVRAYILRLSRGTEA